MVDVTRRQALAAMGCFGASLGLSGCAAPVVPFCPGDPTISDPTSPLTIDVHTHFFNGSDLQIFGFYNYVVARQVSKSLLATLLQILGNDFAPTAADEMVALTQVEEALRSCNTPVFLQVLNAHAQDRYDHFLSRLKAANSNIRTRRFARGSASHSRLDNLIKHLPKNYSDYKALQRARLRRSGSLPSADLSVSSSPSSAMSSLPAVIEPITVFVAATECSAAAPINSSIMDSSQLLNQLTSIGDKCR